jgi:ATP-binding cassette subfamily D (ALD) long-chain fatty acid import protein
MTPPFGQYTALSASLAGSFRHSHSRISEFAEEIAFLGGEETEKMLVEREYAGLVKHEDTVLMRRWWFGCVEEGIIKWLWGAFGLVVCAIPVFFQLPGMSTIDLGGRTEGSYLPPSFEDCNHLKRLLNLGFVTNRRLLLSSSGMSHPMFHLSLTSSEIVWQMPLAVSCIPTRICLS